MKPSSPIYRKFRLERKSELIKVAPYLLYLHSCFLIVLIVLERLSIQVPFLNRLALITAAWQLLLHIVQLRYKQIFARGIHLLYMLEVFLFILLGSAFSMVLLYYDFSIGRQASSVLVLMMLVSVEFLPAYSLRSVIPACIGFPLLAWYVSGFWLLELDSALLVLAFFPLIAWVIGTLTSVIIERVYFREFQMRYLAEQRREKAKEELIRYENLNKKLEDTKQRLEKEIEERKSVEKKLEQFAAFDELTAVYNRRAGLELLKEALHYAKRKQQPLTIAFVDVDKLKVVNDNFGHQAGDQYLKDVVKLLRKHLRKSDSVSRFGGDEFLIVLSECTSAEAQAIFQRIEDDIRRMNQDGRMYPMSFSYGIAQTSSSYEESLHQLIAMADERMYVNKQKKKWG
ncbi:MAG: GGDEF domain-containing protein [Spirochaetota bacterium]